MLSQLQKIKDLDEETYDLDQFTKVTKDDQPTKVSLIVARREIAKVLMCFRNSILNTTHCRYMFIIYTDAQWTVLGNIVQVVHPINVDT